MASDDLKTKLHNKLFDKLKDLSVNEVVKKREEYISKGKIVPLPVQMVMERHDIADSIDSHPESNLNKPKDTPTPKRPVHKV